MEQKKEQETDGSKEKLLTYAGLKALEDELENLKVVKRREIAQKIKEAREQETYQRTLSTMQQKTSRETLKHVSKNWKQFLRMQKL